MRPETVVAVNCSVSRTIDFGAAMTVTVATAPEQFFEYFNCHPRTGMLRVDGR